jgi:VIT1/CCC1 family predicted Fe2+/Mn2+ transporter
VAERSSITTMILTVLLSPASRPEGQETTIAMGFVRANRRHAEHHAVERLGWLRAAVLGANDGILSTASLIVGVAAAAGTHTSILVAGVSGLVAGAMSNGGRRIRFSDPWP